jgi:hypothetical protein
MDPYLERYWRDVHARFVLYACDQLEPQLPGNLIARVEERIVFENDEGRERSAYPDVKIAERFSRERELAGVKSQAAVLEPVIVEFGSEPATETYINILETNGQRLVTVIEVLSHSNKLPGEGQRLYRQKQAELAEAGVSLVEIDLLRRGDRVLTLPVEHIPKRVRTTYQVCVRRGWSPRRYEVYPVPLQAPLLAIKIPLRERDQDIQLELQAVLEQAYRKGRYHLTPNYAKPADPPLTGADGKWARGVLKIGKRPRA